jgi:hypothetical protein
MKEVIRCLRIHEHRTIMPLICTLKHSVPSDRRVPPLAHSTTILVPKSFPYNS